MAQETRASSPQGGGDGWDDVELDEAFVLSASGREPSARARMLAARWEREQPQPQPWRTDAPPVGRFRSLARKWRRSR
ncbi:SGM_3592 family protein [Streptomyces sp. NPDC002536]